MRNETVVITFANAVPEPSTWATMILGFVGIGTLAYRRRNQVSGLTASPTVSNPCLTIDWNVTRSEIDFGAKAPVRTRRDRAGRLPHRLHHGDVAAELTHADPQTAQSSVSRTRTVQRHEKHHSSPI